jgi:hypothetical protein
MLAETTPSEGILMRFQTGQARGQSAEIMQNTWISMRASGRGGLK